PSTAPVAAAPVADPAAADPAAAAPAAVPPAAQPPSPATDHVTRQEMEELTRQVRQLSAIQLQLMEQLAQLLSRQVATSPTGEQR
ncbi:hypothetical protein, partial [Streptomyces lonarensis]